MTQNVRIAVISAITTIVVALIGASATVLVTAREKTVEVKTETEALTIGTKDAATQTADSGSSEEAGAGKRKFVEVQTMTATATSDHGSLTKQDGPVTADMCALTRVATYGGATKGCTLTREEEGWVLVANARNSTSTCQATCFDLSPRVNSNTIGSKPRATP